MPNRVSIADPGALQLAYAHRNGSLKSEFYDAFVSIHRGDHADHAHKGKFVSHIFSQKSVLEFESIARLCINQLLKRRDRLYDAAVKGGSGTEGDGWSDHGGRLWLDALPCMSLWFRYACSAHNLSGYNYLVFDIIGIRCLDAIPRLSTDVHL